MGSKYGFLDVSTWQTELKQKSYYVQGRCDLKK